MMSVFPYLQDRSAKKVITCFFRAAVIMDVLRDVPAWTVTLAPNHQWLERPLVWTLALLVGQDFWD